MTLPVTLLLAGLFALMAVWLSLQVSMRRRVLLVAVGDAGDETLRRRIRAHGNFSEYAPLALLLVALVEYGGGARQLVCGLAAAFLLGRLMHAIGMLYMNGPALRGIGMVVQHAGFVIAGGWLILRALQF